jgi:polyhydroxyalkanoate synthesis regulator phasin
VAQKDLLNRSLDAGREAGTKASETIEGILDDLSRAAQEQREQIAQIAQDLVDRSQRSSEQVLKAMDRELRVQISHLGLATKADIRRLEKKIEALQHEQVAAKKAAKKKSSASTKKSTASKSTTKKSAKASATSGGSSSSD